VCRYANRARNIKNKPVINRDPSAAQILLLRQQLAAARAEIEVLRNQLHNMQRSGAIDCAHGAEVQMSEVRRCRCAGVMKITSLASRLRVDHALVLSFLVHSPVLLDCKLSNQT
jgi:hypothetical protein